MTPLLLVLALLLLTCQSLAQSVNPPNITGISGCVYSSRVQTIQCPYPVTLTITGNGFFNGLEGELWPVTWLRIELATADNTNSYLCNIAITGSTDTRLVCIVPNNGYGTMVPSVLLDLKLTNQRTGATAMLGQAVSFMNEAAPRVDRVSGCPVISADGRSASQCDIVNDQITLHGSNFHSFEGDSGQLSLGSVTRNVRFLEGHGSIVRFSNQQIVFSFMKAPDQIPTEEVHIGLSLPLLLQDWLGANRWYTEPVRVTFKPLPAPSVRTVALIATTPSCRSEPVANQSISVRYRDCVAGLSNLRLDGEFLFQPVTVTVGGQPCRVTPANGVFRIIMPAFQSVEGVFYDMIVTTVAGSATLPALIEFNHDPLINNIVPCIDTGSSSEVIAPHCWPGQTVTVKVLNIKQSHVPRVWIRNLRNTSHVECLNPVLIDRQTITCTAPEKPDSASWDGNPLVWMYLRLADGSSSIETMVTSLWDPINAPRLSALKGCSSNSNNRLDLNQCLGQPSTPVVLTIHGTGLNQELDNEWQIALGGWFFSAVVTSATTVECLLPSLNETYSGFNPLEYGVRYSMVLTGSSNSTLLRSNAGYVTFVVQIPQLPSGSPSSSKTVMIALASTFSIIGFCMVTLGFYCWYRSSHMQKRFDRAFESSDEFSMPASQVELPDSSVARLQEIS